MTKTFLALRSGKRGGLFWAGFALLAAGLAILLLASIFAKPLQTHELHFTVPPNSSQMIVYPDAQICPRWDSLHLCADAAPASSAGKEVRAYSTTGVSARVQPKKGCRYRVGVVVENPTAQPITATVLVRGAEVRIV